MATTASTSSLATDLRLAVARTARRLRQEADSDLTPTLTSALASIDCHGPLTPSELASRERIRRPTATRLLARLEEMGLIVREDVPGDGRSVLIAATPEGRAHLEGIRTRKSQFLAERLARLPESDRETLSRASELLELLTADDPA